MSADPDVPPPVRSFAGWKCDMLAAMAKDRKMRLVDVAIATLILQRANKQSRVSAITDERLSEEMDRNRATFNEFRKRGEAAGYFDCIPGASGRATTYKWKDDRLDQIRNIELDQRILDSERDKDNDQEDNGATHLAYRKLSTRAASSVQKTKHSNGSVASRKLNATSHSVQKTERCSDSAKNADNVTKGAENLTHSAEKTEHLHSLSSLKDSLPEEVRASAHTYTYDAHIHAYDRWAEFEEISARLEFDEQLTRQEAEHQARGICGFDDADAEGWRGIGTTSPTEATSDLEKGTSDDHDY